MKKIILLLCSSALIFTSACGDDAGPTGLTTSESSCIQMDRQVINSSNDCRADATCFKLSNGKWCTGTSDDTTSELKLVTTDGLEIPAISLGGIYRQGIFPDGSMETTSLQFQFLDSPGKVAFALYLENPEPGTPFVTTAKQEGGFVFEAFSDGIGYKSLINSEIELRLESLPAPADLSDEEMVSFKGKLVINEFALAERSSLGVVGSRELVLAAQEVPVDCDTEFTFSEIEF